MQTKELQALAEKVLADAQAMDLTVLDVRQLTTITDIMIVCSGRSTRQVKSIADKLVAEALACGVTYLRMEGEQESEWVLVDMGDLVVHIMLPAVRQFYDLEALWEPLPEMRKQQR